MKELKKVKSRVKGNYEEVEQQEKPSTYVVVDENFFDDIPNEITDKMEKFVMKKATQLAQEMEEQTIEKIEDDLQDKMQALDDAINEQLEMEAKAEPQTNTKLPDNYFQIGDRAIALNAGGVPNVKLGDIVDITNTDGNGTITDVNNVNKNRVNGYGSWKFSNVWYEKITEDNQQEQESSQDAQNDSASNESPQGGESCTKAERDFLDSFLELQEAGKLLGMTRTGEQIRKYPIANMFIVPRVNEVTNADKVFAYELQAGDSKEVWGIVKVKAEEMGEKMLEMYKERDEKNIEDKGQEKLSPDSAF